MIRKILVVSTALAAISVFALVTEPVNARGSCVVLAAKGRGVDEATKVQVLRRVFTCRLDHRLLAAIR